MILRRVPLGTALLALVALVLAFLIGHDVVFPPASSTASTVRTATVVRGAVRAAVTGTGSLVPLTSQNVGFRTAGTLTEVDVRVGDRVTAGQVLGKIDPTSLQAAYDQAAAAVTSAQANLQNTLTGVTLAQALHSLQNAQQTYSDTVNSVNLTNQQDQATLSADQQQLNADSATLAADQAGYWYQQYGPTMSNYQGNYGQALAAYQRDGCSANQPYPSPTPAPSPSASPSPAPTPGPCANDRNQLQVAQNNLNCLQQGGPTCTTDQQQIAAAFRSVAADQSRLSADAGKIAGDQAKLAFDQQSGQTRVNGALNAVTAAQDGVNLQSASRPATIASQQAAIESAQAALTTAQANLNAATLTAPFSGTVTAVNGSVGDNTTAAGSSTPATGTGSSSSASSTAFVVLGDLSTFQIVTPFAEADASRVQVGQAATVTFDAVTGLTAPAHVTLVAPTATVSSNVVNYSVTAALDQTDPRLKAGMTSNVSVTVASATSVLVVPNSAITRVGNRFAFVTVVGRDGRQARTPVQLGVAGDSTTEITSGVQDGDHVLLPQLRASTASGQAGGRGAGLPGGGGGGGAIRVG